MGDSNFMILIVGGAGYIGSHVNKMLSNKHFSTIVFDNLYSGHEDFVKWGTLFQGDLSDIDSLRILFKKYPIKAVMHFAAYAYVGESVLNPQKYYINNVKNTLNLLQVMLEKGVKYFIFSSSCATYGNPSGIPILEEHVQKPISPYGQSKLMVERILHDYSTAFDFRFVTLRYFNAAGADPDGELGEWHEPETHLIPLTLDVASGMRNHISILGTDYETKDGTCIRDYIHVTDLAVAHVQALEYLLDGGINDCFNLGNGSGFSVKDVIEQARIITGRPIIALEKPRRVGDPPVLVGSSEKAKRILNWNPIYNELPTILQTAWRWHTRKCDLSRGLQYETGFVYQP
jgi:UDP-glucose 4-epimerase